MLTPLPPKKSPKRVISHFHLTVSGPSKMKKIQLRESTGDCTLHLCFINVEFPYKQTLLEDTAL